MCYNVKIIREEEIIMDEIYIFGHKNPDTDSVTASIALSYLKNKTRMKTTPRVLGDINNETKFVLDYFKVPQPKYLNDVKLQIKDLDYQKDFFIEQKKSIQDGYQAMDKGKVSTIPVVDEHEKLVGILSMKNIAHSLISGDFQNIHTSLDNLLQTLEGKELLKFDDIIDGQSLVASYRSTTFMQNIKLTKDHIVIVGDRHSIIEYAVNSGIKLLIISGSGYIKEEHLEIAKKNHVSVIKTDMRTLKVAQKLVLSNYIENITHKENIISVKNNADVTDFIELSKKNKFSNYPVVDDFGKCLGYLTVADVNDKKPKRVILVDHNEYEQSVDGLDEATILEIIDHHKIGTLATSVPINFRNMPVGSSNTIIFQLYMENNIEIPKEIAGLMLSGILSDTLLLKSPTTTMLDQHAVLMLANIAGVDYQQYGMEMFKAASSLTGKTMEEILYNDFKNFAIDNKKIGVGQIFTMNIDEILEHQEELLNLIERTAKNNNYTLITLFVTDIINNGSYMFYNEKAAEILENCFDTEIQQGAYIAGCVSRKKQIIPPIMDYLDKK